MHKLDTPRISPSIVFAKRLLALYPLGTEELVAVQQVIGSTKTYPAHSEVIHEGEMLNTAPVLLSGLACRYKVVDSARRQMTGFVVPGDVCDFSFLSSSAASQGLLTLGQATIGFIDLNRFSALTEKMPNIMIAIMRAAALEQASAQELVISLGARDAIKRLAHLICELHHRLGVVGLVRSGHEFDLMMTQAELGEALGLSTVHINRTVQHLRRENMISMGQGVITILDPERLAAVAGFNARYLQPGQPQPEKTSA